MAAVAEFSELWVTDKDPQAFEARLQAAMDAACATIESKTFISWLPLGLPSVCGKRGARNMLQSSVHCRAEYPGAKDLGEAPFEVTV